MGVSYTTVFITIFEKHKPLSSDDSSVEGSVHLLGLPWPKNENEFKYELVLALVI